MTLFRGLWATLSTLLAVLAFAAPASAATFADAAGDGADGDPGHDITRFDWAYDGASGTATGTVTMAGQAASDAFVFMFFGAPGAGGTCSNSDAVALGGYLDASTGNGQWVPFSNGTGGTGGANQPRKDGALTTGFTARDARLAGRGYACAIVRVYANPNDASPLDEAAGPVPAAPQPAPQPVPTPGPTVTAPAPAPAPAPKAKLRATLKGVPARVKRGRAFRARLTVRNVGTKASARMTVSFKRARGLAVRPKRLKLKALAPGKARTVKLRIALSRRARTSTPLVVTARGGGLKTTARAALRTRKPRPKPKPKPGNPLVNTFWWWNDFKVDSPFTIYALRFYDNGYAYYRLPEDDAPAPAKCTSVTARADEDGDFGPGCVRWSLKGKTLSFSDPRWTGTYANGKLSIRDKEKAFATEELVAPKPGARFNVSYWNVEVSGFCSAGLSCSTTKTYLTLQPDGTFGLAEESLFTFDVPGVSYTAAGSYPPDKRGTYTVLPGYRMRLDYADGSRREVPFGLIDGTSPVDSATKFVLGRLPFWVKDPDD